MVLKLRTQNEESEEGSTYRLISSMNSDLIGAGGRVRKKMVEAREK